MLDKLKKKWKVNGIQLVLILCTFALGGSLCGYLGKNILSATPLDKDFLWYVLYIILVTLLWPLCVLVISIPLGQFTFFKNYLLRVARRLKIKKD
jgi:hypothetical protein